MLTRMRDAFGKWMTAAILALISGGFVFWGINFQFNTGSYAAKVNGQEIALERFQRNVQQQESQFQQTSNADLTRVIRNELKQSVLERLIQEAALNQRIQDEGYAVSDARMASALRSVSAFQIDGKFSQDAYRNYLVTQGETAPSFEARQRETLALLDFQQGVADSSFVTTSELARYVALVKEKRRFGYAVFKADDFAKDVKVTDDEVADYYKAHQNEFMTEEAVSLKYIKLDRAALAKSIQVSDAELRQYYDEHKDQYAAPEEREADHILITAKPGETDAQTKARAEAALKRVQSGEDFAKVAKEVSQDPGTAEQGGALGWIGRGMLAGPFEDTLFSMKLGEIKGPVKTDFGYHIIKLDKIRGGDAQPFDKVKDQLLEQLRNQRADDVFYKTSNNLANAAFDAYDNLDSVAEQLGLPLKSVDRFPRSGDPDVFKNSAPVVAKLFEGVPLQPGVNSDLIKLSDEAVVIVNVGEHFSSTEKPLDKVSAKIHKTLADQKAAAAAESAAKAFKAALPTDIAAAFMGSSGVDGDVASAESADASTAQGESGAGGKSVSAKDGSKADSKSTNKSDENTSGAAPASTLSGAAALAASKGGSWVAPAWIARDDTSVPTELLVDAFTMPLPAANAVQRTEVTLKDGAHGVILLAGVEPGKTQSLKATEIDALRQQLSRQISGMELSSYIMTVRDEASVKVADSVLSDVQ